MKNFACTFMQKHNSMTEEELKAEKRRQYWRKWREKNPDRAREYMEKQLEQKAVHSEKRFKVRYNGFTCIIGTLDRFTLRTAYIDGKFKVSATNKEKLSDIRRMLLNESRSWIYSQDLWDKNKRIFIVDIPIDDRAKVKCNVIGVQLTFLREGEFKTKALTTKWHELHKSLEPLCEQLYKAMEKAVQENGLKLVNWHSKDVDLLPEYASNEDSELDD